MRLLLDEMFPSETAKHLREEFGHDAVHVDDLGLRGAADPHVASVARAALEETAEILSDDDTLAAIRRGLDDLAAGDEVALDEVRQEIANRERT